MTDPGAESGWRCVLKLREVARAAPGGVRGYGVRLGPEAGDAEASPGELPEARAGCHRAWIAVDGEPPDLDAAVARLEVERWLGLARRWPGAVPEGALRVLTRYGAYALLPTLARSLGRAVAVSHFAQSLDGRIATPSGDSRWIGDEANRVHAHRMRALCDAILVGAQTARRDRPRLTVRHVEGRDPARVVLGRSAPELEEELARMRAVSAAPVLCVVPRSGAGVGEAGVIEVEGEGGAVSPRALLRALWSRGWASVYVEGGQRTTSGFLTSGALDIVQVHVSPLILGAGPVGFALGEGGAAEVAEASRFEAHRFEAVGGGVLFVGWRGE